MRDLKSEARRIFRQTLLELDVKLAVSRHLRIEGEQLSAAGTAFDLRSFRSLVIVAIGKAAAPMYEAAAAALAGVYGSSLAMDSIVVSPQPPTHTYGKLRHFIGAHPTPDERSREAALAILHRLHKADAETLVLFLISGGASSMVEMAQSGTISIADMAEFHRTLVGSGLSISEMNVLRKHISAVKGGRLATAASPAAQITLIVSDVPPAALDIVGSGPSMPDASSDEQCRDIYLRLRSGRRVPEAVARWFEPNRAMDRPETRRAGHPAFERAAWASILSSDDLGAKAASIAAAAGFSVVVDNSCDEWDYREAAAYLLDRSARLGREHGRSCVVSTGELAVTLDGPAGLGGRNQQFALQCAINLAASGEATTLLSAGSDGIDGNSPAAGAVADRDTCRRAAEAGFDPLLTLAAFNSSPLFERLGDQIVTGPTGNNLRDLRLLLTE